MGLRLLVQRIYVDVRPYTLSFTLRRPLVFLCMLLQRLPPRIGLTRPLAQSVVVIASDAQAAPGSQPSAGAICLAGPDDLRLAVFSQVPKELLALWGYSREVRDAGGNPIALCEASVVLFAMWQFWDRLAGRQVIWSIDNTAALHSFVKCMSKHDNLS